jgi:hypothetical protein
MQIVTDSDNSSFFKDTEKVVYISMYVHVLNSSDTIYKHLYVWPLYIQINLSFYNKTSHVLK